MRIIEIKDGKIWLNSGLNQESFGRTKLSLSIEEKGKIAEFDGKEIRFSDFEFADIENKNGSVFFTAELSEGKSFLEILSENDEENKISEKAGDFETSKDAEPKEIKKNDETKEVGKIDENCEKNLDFQKNATEKLILALTNAYEKNENLNVSGGAAGIIFANEKIIFLPPELFEQCAQNCTESSEKNGGNFKFVYKGLSPKEQILFFRSVAAYKSLTKKFPFEENDLTKRQVDIGDEKFIPIKLYLPKISEKLADSIDAGLKIKPEEFEKAGKRELKISKDAKKNQKNLNLAENFDIEEFNRELENLQKNQKNKENSEKNKNAEISSKKFSENADAPEISIEEKNLEKKRSAFVKKMSAKIAIKRFFRRNKTAILAIAAFLAFAAWMANGFVKENRQLATSKGLDSTQTAAAMYTFIHKADVPNLQEIAKGKQTKDLIFKVAGFYVTSKQREEQNAADKSVSPGKWLFYNKNSSNWMYGITNLKIDGKNFPAENKYPKRMEKPESLKEENGKILKRGDKAVHTAEYYLVHQDSNRIYAEKTTEEVELEWNGKRWIVKGGKGKSSPISVKSKTFSDEYYGLLEEGKSIKDAVSNLKTKYEWLPDENDIKNDAKFLAEKYGSKEAENFLKNFN